MTGLVRGLALTLVGGALLSVGPPSKSEYSPELLALLDPTAMASALCGGKAGGDSMRAKLMVAAAVTQGTSVAAAPLYDGLGKVHFPITTANPLAQRYFDQGLSFAYGFNHAAAIAAFREAQKLDPGCALCLSGSK